MAVIHFSKEGFDKAVAQGSPMLVDFWASWCGPCKMLANNVFTKDEVADYFNQTFVNAKYDMEKDEDGIILKTQFGVKAFPTLVFVDPATQQVVHRMVGAGSAEWLVEGAKTAGDPQNNRFDETLRSRREKRRVFGPLSGCLGFRLHAGRTGKGGFRIPEYPF